LTAAGFVVGDDVLKRDESSFFSAELFYPAVFDTGPGLRPHIRIEMSLNASTLPPIARPLGSTRHPGAKQASGDRSLPVR
jgi:hypothetical protein